MRRGVEVSGRGAESDRPGQAQDVAPLFYLHRVAIMGRCPNVNKPKLIYFLFMTLRPSGKGTGPIIPRKHAGGGWTQQALILEPAGDSAEGFREVLDGQVTGEAPGKSSCLLNLLGDPKALSYAILSYSRDIWTGEASGCCNCLARDLRPGQRVIPVPQISVT